MLHNTRVARVLVGLVSCAAAGCSTTTVRTLGDPRTAPIYGYTPLDPIPVIVDATNPSRDELLLALPDETMRIAIGEVTAEGGVEFGTASIGVQGRDYEVVLDYIKFTTKSFAARISMDTAGVRTATFAADESTADAFVPVYVGVGIRMRASIRIIKGSVNLGNLIGIGMAAEAGNVSGTLVIQTLGLSGVNVSPLIPVPSTIDDSTIQNAMVALGSIKAKLYEPGTEIVPRVVGVYNTLGGGEETVNRFISALFEEPITLNVTTRSVTRGQLP